MIHWEHLPPALEPDTIGQIWSGSAVIDWNNTSGLQTGKEPVFVALFTYNEHVDSQQSQGLAYSNDRGRTWRKYWGNPVLTSGGEKRTSETLRFFGLKAEPAGLWFWRASTMWNFTSRKIC